MYFVLISWAMKTSLTLLVCLTMSTNDSTVLMELGGDGFDEMLECFGKYLREGEWLPWGNQWGHLGYGRDQELWREFCHQYPGASRRQSPVLKSSLGWNPLLNFHLSGNSYPPPSPSTIKLYPKLSIFQPPTFHIFIWYIIIIKIYSHTKI